MCVCVCERMLRKTTHLRLYRQKYFQITILKERNSKKQKEKRRNSLNSHLERAITHRAI